MHETCGQEFREEKCLEAPARRTLFDNTGRGLESEALRSNEQRNLESFSDRNFIRTDPAVPGGLVFLLFHVSGICIFFYGLSFVSVAFA
jgi:hypothetical protein